MLIHYIKIYCVICLSIRSALLTMVASVIGSLLPPGGQTVHAGKLEHASYNNIIIYYFYSYNIYNSMTYGI